MHEYQWVSRAGHYVPASGRSYRSQCEVGKYVQPFCLGDHTLTLLYRFGSQTTATTCYCKYLLDLLLLHSPGIHIKDLYMQFVLVPHGQGSIKTKEHDLVALPALAENTQRGIDHCFTTGVRISNVCLLGGGQQAAPFSPRSP
jgi:hypothetical protein